MKNLISQLLVVLTLVSICVDFFSQTLDFGIDAKVNSNIIQGDLDYGNGYSDLSIKYPQYSYAIFDDGTFEYETEEDGKTPYLYNPYPDFSMIDLYGDTINCIRRGYKVNNNFEIPIYLRFTSKNNWFFDLRYSSSKYEISYHGNILQDDEYYKSYYAMDDFINDYGAQYDNDTLAYMQWFNQAVKSDNWSKAEMYYQEQFKYRSIYLSAGYKFLPHKTIRPILSFGVGYRVTDYNYMRKYFEIDDNYLGYSEIKTDLRGVNDALPGVKNQAISYRLAGEIEFYRYHIGLEFEQTFYTAYRSGADLGEVFNYNSRFNVFSTLSFKIGADLGTFNLKKKDFRKKIYEEEYNSLTSLFVKRQKWAIGARIEAPFASEVRETEPFSVFLYTENLNPESGYSDFAWQSLSFGDITRVNWLPKFDVFYRRNLFRRVDFEVEMNYSNLEFDTKVEDFQTLLVFDPNTGNYKYDIYQTKLNYATYRNNIDIFGLNTKIYATVFQNNILDIKIYGGIGVNYLSYKEGGADKDVGVNGNGEDIYESFENYQYNSYTDGDIFYFSEYAGGVDLDAPSGETLDNYFDFYGDGGTQGVHADDWTLNVNDAYGLVIAGIELEYNRFIIGISSDISIAYSVDGMLIENYYNINGTIGYLLFTKNKPNKYLQRE